MHHAFLYISLPSLHDYDVKMPIFTFLGEVNTGQWLSFSFPELWYSLLEFNSRRNCQQLANWTQDNKHDKVWSSATSLFKWRFRSRRCRCYLFISSLSTKWPGNTVPLSPTLSLTHFKPLKSQEISTSIFSKQYQYTIERNCYENGQNDHQREKVLIFYKIILIDSLRKCKDIHVGLENLYEDLLGLTGKGFKCTCNS